MHNDVIKLCADTGHRECIEALHVTVT